ncbi:MAG: hypothetical protein ACNI3C_07660 [Candidatus Marinarcus sp.]|uniref:hypothetical protein n=1 Tax=Candidatus Marinarcus sp. TaxID=3100987 RepID=UPI003B002620
MKTTHIVSLEELNTLTVDVSESILDELLLEFAYTHFEQHKMPLNHTHKIFSSYLPLSQQYFFCAFASKNNEEVIAPYVLSSFYLNQIQCNTTDVFILDNFFALYQNGKLLYFKLLKELVLKHEITNFIQKSLQLKLDNIYEISESDFKHYQTLFLQEESKLEKFDSIAHQKRTHLKRFVFYNTLIFFCLCGYFFFYDFINTQNMAPQSSFTPLKQKKSLTLPLTKLFQNINTYGLKLINVEVNNKTITLKLSHSHKMTLIEFMKLYASTIENISYNTKENQYELTATLKFT